MNIRSHHKIMLLNCSIARHCNLLYLLRLWRPVWPMANARRWSRNQSNSFSVATHTCTSKSIQIPLAFCTSGPDFSTAYFYDFVKYTLERMNVSTSSTQCWSLMTWEFWQKVVIYMLRREINWKNWNPNRRFTYLYGAHSSRYHTRK